MTPTYFEWLERKDLRSTALDVIEFTPVDMPEPEPEPEAYVVEELTDEQWAALVKRLAGAA